MGNAMVNALMAAGVVFAIGYGWIAHLQNRAGGARVSGPAVIAVVVAPTPTWGQATACRWEAGSPATVRNSTDGGSCSSSDGGSNGGDCGGGGDGGGGGGGD